MKHNLTDNHNEVIEKFQHSNLSNLHKLIPNVSQEKGNLGLLQKIQRLDMKFYL